LLTSFDYIIISEKMTSSDQTELDWALAFQVCELVNGSELGAKEARKLLQKKMLSNETKTQVLALEVGIVMSCNPTNLDSCFVPLSSILVAECFI
jgi:hypothetical protein